MAWYRCGNGGSGGSEITYKNYMKFNGEGMYLPWKINADHKIEVVFYETDYRNDGAVIGNSADSRHVHLTTYSNKYYCSSGENEQNFGSWSAGEHTFICNNGNSHNEFDSTEVTEYTPLTFNDIYYTLGCRGDSTGRNAYFGYIKSYKIYSISGGTLLHHLKPCIVLNQSAFVDVIEGRFYLNQSIQALDTLS